MPSNIRIGLRIHITTVVAVLGLFAIAGLQVLDHVRDLERDRVATLRGVAQAATSIAVAYQAEEAAGRLDRGSAQGAALAAIKALRYGSDDYVWVNDLTPRMVMPPFRPDLDGKDMSEVKDPSGLALFLAFTDRVRRDGSGMVGYLWPRPGASEPVEKLSFVQGFAPWGWVLGTGVYVDDLRAEQRRILMQAASEVVPVAFLVALLAWLAARGIVRPLAAITSVTERLASGQIDIAVPGGDRRDEVGVLARAVETFRVQGVEKRRLEAAAAAERAAKDRRQLAVEHHIHEFGITLSGVMQSLARSAEAMRATAQGVADAALQADDGARSTAAGAEQSSADLQASRQRPRSSPRPAPRSPARSPRSPPSPPMRRSRRSTPRRGCRALPIPHRASGTSSG